MSYYNNGNSNNYGGGYNGGYGQQQPHPQQPEGDFDDYYTHNNTSNQWDSRSTKSSHTAHSNYSTVPINKPYGQQPPMPAPYQQPAVVDYPPTHRVQFPGGFGAPQRTFTGESGGFSTARDKLLKRRSVRQVPLQNGNLVFDVQVPSHIVTSSEKSEEFTKMRYSAVTCDPDDFAAKKYSLRPYLYGRHTELFIVLTMYNEDEVLFVRTMNAVIKNISFLCSRTRSKMWGPDGWKKVVVCVVSDGRSKINQRTLKVLNLMGCYQEGIAKDSVNGKDVTAHVFEYTSQVVVSDTGEVSTGACPVQIIFCLKEQNKKKLNSHRWFFNAFGPLIKPNVCILLDVGTKPTGTSIYELWKCFDKHSNVGGACGEICVDTGKACSLLLTSPLAASQNFEYKMSNVLDKPLESVFGYISVLPGAFSAYRYKALQNGANGKGPLASYFKGETMHGDGPNGAGLFERNMYLAEDRILCFEIVVKKKEGWVLKYVKSAKASTDVPTTIAEFISQRRRWLNGSLFAALHATVYMLRIWTSGQSFLRKIILQFEFIYNAIQLFFSWTALANFYLAFFFLVQSASNAPNGPFAFMGSGNVGPILFDILLKLYIAVLFVVTVCSLGNRPQGSKITYGAAMILFGFCNVVALWCAGYTVYAAAPKSVAEWSHFGHLVLTNAAFRDIVISLSATYGLYLFSSILHAEPWHIFTCFIQYMFLLPSYVNILMMYAMCNLHDVSWGTKGDNGAAKDLGGAKKVANKEGQDMYEVELPSAREDVDSVWAASKAALRNKPAEEKQHRDAATKQADHDRNSRTNTVLAWVATNMTMILIFTSSTFQEWAAKYGNGSAFNPYLTFLFYALAGLSAIRFTGSTLYLILRLCGL